MANTAGASQPVRNELNGLKLEFEWRTELSTIARCGERVPGTEVYDSWTCGVAALRVKTQPTRVGYHRHRLLNAGNSRDPGCPVEVSRF